MRPRGRVTDRYAPFGHHDGAIPEHELGAMVPDSQPLPEAEGAAEPLGRHRDVGYSSSAIIEAAGMDRLACI